MVNAKPDFARIFSLGLFAEQLYIGNIYRRDKLRLKVIGFNPLKHKRKILGNRVGTFNSDPLAHAEQSARKSICAAECVTVGMAVTQQQNLIGIFEDFCSFVQINSH